MFKKIKLVTYTIAKGAQLTSSAYSLVSDFKKYQKSESNVKEAECLLMRFDKLVVDAVYYMKQFNDCTKHNDHEIFECWLGIQKQDLQEDFMYMGAMLDVEELALDI